MNQPTASPTTDPSALAPGRRRLRPAHLAAWIRGSDLDDVTPGTVDPVVDHDSALPTDPDAPFDPRPWIAGVQGRRPELALAVMYDGDVADPHPDAVEPGAVVWRQRIGAVVDGLAGGSDGFTGDTTPTSLARLRRWTEDALRRAAVPAAAAADVVLLVDELAANVEEHAPGWLTVDLVFSEDRVLVLVSDPHPDRAPALGDPPSDQPTGRGLLVVTALSVHWGIVFGHTSKAVWAEVAWPT